MIGFFIGCFVGFWFGELFAYFLLFKRVMKDHEED